MKIVKTTSESSVIEVPRFFIPISFLYLLAGALCAGILLSFSSTPSTLDKAEAVEAAVPATKSTMIVYTETEVKQMMIDFEKKYTAEAIAKEDKAAAKRMAESMAIIRKGLPKIADKPSRVVEVQRLHGYSPFEITMFHLKAHESFRPYWYYDGQFPSIGGGYNLVNGIDFISEEIADGVYTFDEGMGVMHRLIEQYKQHIKAKRPNVTEFQAVALAVHMYNTGKIETLNSRQSGCCGYKNGCGRIAKKDKDIRNAHNARRAWELRLYNGQLTKKEIETDRKAAVTVDKYWKKAPHQSVYGYYTEKEINAYIKKAEEKKKKRK